MDELCMKLFFKRRRCLEKNITTRIIYSIIRKEKRDVRKMCQSQEVDVPKKESMTDDESWHDSQGGGMTDKFCKNRTQFFYTRLSSSSAATAATNDMLALWNSFDWVDAAISGSQIN